jgi:fructose-1,6-bisphosphatase II
VATSEPSCICDGFVRVTEAAARAAGEWVGRGDGLAADLAAREAMAAELDSIPFRARIVAGRGGRRSDCVLRVGDEVGRAGGEIGIAAQGGGNEGAGTSWELALDPLEGHVPLAKGADGALAMLVFGPPGSMMAVPEMYMQKMIVGQQAATAIDIDAPVIQNIRTVAVALGRPKEDLNVVVLERARHEDLIAQIRSSGARVRLIENGDASAGIASAFRGTGVDVYIGIGGSTQGVITAAALRCLGGEIQARFWPVSRHQVEELKSSGVADVEARLTTGDLAGDGVLVSITAVTGGRLLRGVEFHDDGAHSETLLLCSRCHSVKVVKTIHRSSDGGPPVRLDAR